MRTMLWTMLVTALVACSPASGTPAPREIAAGVDACDYCHMTVDDALRAAQWIDTAGKTRMFDEVGCLVAWLQKNPAPGRAFVADEEGSGWVPAEEAYYLRGGASTGMGFDLLAFRDRSSAEARARETGGSVEEWRSVRTMEVKDAHTH